MKAVLIDDEYYALQGLKMELDDIDSVQVVGMFEDAYEALEQIKQLSPDIVFLDIEMPGINGIQLFEKILAEKTDIHIIFVTAYSAYAVKAFELNALDYVLKPVDKERLQKTIARIPVGEETKANNTHMLRVQCFKQFTLSVDDNVINLGTRNRKAEELIAYLACEKGQYVAKVKIADDLWPNLDAEKNLNSLYMALYYINKKQKELKIDIPIESAWGKMRLETEAISLDLDDFDNYISACEVITLDNIHIAEKALDLYRGMVLEENYYVWTDIVQQNYQIKYMNLLEKMLEFYSENNEEEKYRFIKTIWDHNG